jgi:DNA-binding response OmpR family regulator
METQGILIVDDEKNIRLTLAQALEPMGYQIDEAINGEEALAKLAKGSYDLMLLDLKMPGIDGIEVLSASRTSHPTLSVIIITAHGSIDSAVEAMKLGAVDFIQKPFSPQEIRDLIRKVLERRELAAEDAADYDSHVELTKLRITERDFAGATELARSAVALEPGRPEAFNLLGALWEIRGEISEAQKSYRAALAVDPTYKPARDNLTRATRWGRPKGEVVLDEAPPEPGEAPERERDEA